MTPDRERPPRVTRGGEGRTDIHPQRSRTLRQDAAVRLEPLEQCACHPRHTDPWQCPGRPWADATSWTQLVQPVVELVMVGAA
jgi:hypothetical protein